MEDADKLFIKKDYRGAYAAYKAYSIEFAKGRVRHPDHKSLVLNEWRRVYMNTEDRSVGATWVD